MTVSIETDPSTADLLLFGDPRYAAEALGEAIDAQRMLQTIRGGARRADTAFRDALNGNVAQAGSELLSGLDLGTCLLGGWSKYRELRLAARKTVENPGSTQLVRLAEHKITSNHAPYVEVFLDGKRVARVDFGIKLEFDIALLQAGVSQGRIMSFHAPACTASITWSVRGFTIARNEAPISFKARANLGKGIPLYREN
ncbi:hypothetical protein [Streptosporangium sp. NPDC001681]|uniref:hypothetical protein n=1 Tax=Streptosporangium sp. NPDC001681 TaxID=3154395 RepID=UPI00331BF9AF